MQKQLSSRELSFDWTYGEDLSLRDQTAVLLRLLRPEDRYKLREAFNRLSPESRFRRFLMSKSRLTTRELDYLCNLDQYHHTAIWAERSDGSKRGKGMGIARCIRLENRPWLAEIAVTVVDEFQQRGLGRTLLERMVAAAVERGIRTFRARVLRSHDLMQHLFGEIGDCIEIADREQDVIVLDIHISGRTAAD